MKSIWFVLSALLLLLATAFAQSVEPKTVRVSAGEHLITYSGPDAEGQLTVLATNTLASAGVATASTRRRMIYLSTHLPVPAAPADGAARKKKKRTPKPAAIATFRRHIDGTLTHLHTAGSGMRAGFLSLDATESFLAGNDYGNGKAALWRLAADGVYRGAEPDIEVLERCAHAAVFTPNNRRLLVPATCANKIFQLDFDPVVGTLTPVAPAPGPTEEGNSSQPRHILFHPNKPLVYASHERELAGAGVWTYDPETSSVTHRQSILAVDPADAEEMTTAQLKISPDARFLFVSLRDKNGRTAPSGAPTRDAIVVYRIEPETGALAFAHRVPCERIPRAIDLTLDGRFLIVSGQGENTLGVYRVDPETGALEKTFQADLPGRPSWVIAR